MDYIGECGIVFHDINMDGMDGLDVARQIKAEWPKVHIVLVTAYVNYALAGYKVPESRSWKAISAEEELARAQVFTSIDNDGLASLEWLG